MTAQYYSNINLPPVPTIDNLEKFDLRLERDGYLFIMGVERILCNFQHHAALEREQHWMSIASVVDANPVPNYVHSLDAAISLVGSVTGVSIYPNFYSYLFSATVIQSGYSEIEKKPIEIEYTGTQSTRAAALTIAALRALEAGKR